MSGGTRQQVVSAPWVYYPLLKPAENHPITRNLNRVEGEFVNYIDTVGLDPSNKEEDSSFNFRIQPYNFSSCCYQSERSRIDS